MTDTATGRWERYNDAGRRSLGQGQLAEAEQAFRAAVQEAEQLGPASPQLATSLNALGQLRLQAKDLADAETHLTRALAIRETVYGGGHQALIPTLNNLGALYDAKGDLDKAEEALQRALAICQQQLGAEHPDVALALSNLAKLHFKRREFAKADRLLIRLLAIRRSLGKDHPEVATVLGSLARLRQAVGKHDLAEQLWRQALGIRERAFAPKDPIIAATLESLADACAPQSGRLADAIAFRERALEIRVAAHGEGSAAVASARAKLAELQARLEAAASPELTPVPELPPERPSREGQAAPISLEGPRFTRDMAVVQPMVPPPAGLPYIHVEHDEAPSASAPGRNDEVSFALPGAVPPGRPLRPTPPPQPAAHGRPRPATGSMPAASARPTPLRATGQRAPVRPPVRRPRRRGKGPVVLLVCFVLLGAAGGGGWYAITRGLVAPPRAIAGLIARWMPTAPVATAAVAETITPAPAPDSVVAAAPVQPAVDSAAPAPQKVAAAPKPRPRPPVDATPDDGLHPKVSVNLSAQATRGAVQLDAITRAIDRAGKARMDSLERARLGLPPTRPRRP